MLEFSLWKKQNRNKCNPDGVYIAIANHLFPDEKDRATLYIWGRESINSRKGPGSSAKIENWLMTIDDDGDDTKKDVTLIVLLDDST